MGDVERLRAELDALQKQLAERALPVTCSEVDPGAVEDLDIHEDAMPCEAASDSRPESQRAVRKLNTELRTLRAELNTLRKQLAEHTPPVTCIEIDVGVIDTMDIQENAAACF